MFTPQVEEVSKVVIFSFFVFLVLNRYFIDVVRKVKTIKGFAPLTTQRQKLHIYLSYTYPHTFSEESKKKSKIRPRW